MSIQHSMGRDDFDGAGRALMSTETRWHVKGWHWVMAGIVALGLTVRCQGQVSNLTLVDKGVSLAPIIVFSNAPPMTRQAANELAAYMEKVGGAKPEIIEGLPSPIPEHAIWVGFQPKLKALFPQTDFDFHQREEILIAANERHLVIAGRDRWDPAHMQPKIGRSWGTNYFGQQEYGTCNAVYTFLQDYLGVRWLWQGEIGEDIVKKETIILAPFEYRFAPPIRMRCGVMYWWDRPLQRGKLCADWARFQRLILDSSGNLFHPIANGHGFYNWWERFHEKHPDYFALQPDGTRSGYPGPKTVKMCLSNPALWDAWLDDVARQLEEDPTRTCFSAAENDNSTAGYCICTNCIAWDAPEAKKRLLVWSGLSQEYVAMSDRQVRFANTLGRKLKERYPDKDYYVIMGGYGPTLPAPLTNKPDANVIVAFVGHLFSDMNSKDRWSLEPEGETFARQISDWAATGAKLAYRPNLPGEGGWGYGLPDVAFGRVMECFRHYVKNNCEGFCLAAIWNFWPTQGPLYYMLAQLAWNPDQDGHKILDDYYRRGFGPAAGSLKEYWTLQEETRNRMVDGKLSYGQAYDEAFFKRAGSLLDMADAVLAKEPEKYRQRVAHVRIGLDFTRRVVETLELQDRYKAGHNEDPQIADRLRENAKMLSRSVQGDTPYYMGPSHGFDAWLKSMAPPATSAAGVTAGPPGAGVAKKVENTGPKGAAAPKTNSSPSADDPEKSGWTLCFSDDFKRHELGKDWVAIDGDWKVENGCLRGSGTLISARGFPPEHPPGYQRLEFEAATDVHPIVFFKDQPKPKVMVSDLSCFIHAQSPEKGKRPIQTGYFFQFGGKGNTSNRLNRKGVEVLADFDPDHLVVQEQKHRVVLENDQGVVRCRVDGKTILETKEKQSVFGQENDRVGLFFFTAAKVYNVKVYLKRLPSDLDLD